MTNQLRPFSLLVAIALVITLVLAALPAYIALAACPAGVTLNLTLLNDPHLLVDSNNPAAGPRVTAAYAKITNTGAAAASDVYMYVGNGITPGTFTTGSDGQKLSMLGSVADATRFIGNLAPGESKTVYWMLKYPLTYGQTYPMTIWGSNAAGCFVQGSHTFTTQSSISASADKILGTVTLNPADGQVHVGNILTVTVTGFNFGTIGSNGDAWLQPVGNLDFNPDQFRLIKTETCIHSIAGVCGYGSMPVYDRSYFPGIRTCYNFNAADYVKYYFVAISEGTTTAKLYQEAASGAQEKYSIDYGTPGATVTFTAHCGGVTLWKSVNPQTATANTTLTWTITYRNDSGLPIGDPGTGNGLTVREDAIPANTTYVAGSAACSGSCIIYYSTDNGVTWTTTEPAPTSVTRIKWFISQVIPAGSSGTVGFQSKVNSDVMGAPLICNSASAGVGDCPFAPTDTVCANGGVDLDLVKVTSDHSPCEGSQITYTVTVSNPSTTGATGVQVTDLLPSGLTYISSSTSHGTYSSGTGLWNVGNLAGSSSATLTITAMVNAGTGDTTIVNWASITHADQTDPVVSNNVDHDGITVHAPPAAYAASNSPVCVTDTIQLYGGPSGMNYAWTGPSFSSNLQNPTRPNATLAMTGSYTLTVTSPDGCSDTVSTYVTVQTCATPPATPANFSPSPATCVGLPVTLTASIFSDPGSGEHQDAAQWQIRASTGDYSDPVFDSGPDTVNLNSITIPAGILSDSSSYCWHVRYQDNLGAWSEYSSETCFYTKPVALAYSNTPVCVGDTIQLYGGPSGMNYSWTGPLGFSSDRQRATIPYATVGMTGTYSLTVTDANGCSDITSTYVTIQSCASPPNTPSNQSPASATCVDLPVTLAGSAFSDPGSGEHQDAAQWQIRAGGGGYSDPIFDSGRDTVNLDSITIAAGVLSDASSYFWHVRYQDNLGAWSEYSSETFFFTKPIASASSNSPVCAGQTIQLYGGPGGMVYSWTGPNGFSSGLQNPTIPNATASNAGTYNLMVMGENGCSDTVSTAVTVQPCATPPNRPNNISPSTGACVGLPVTLTASAFSDPGSGEYQTAAHWQIRADTGDYSNPVFDSVTGPLTSLAIPLGILSQASGYYWHVRYQGNLGAWSEYSAETFFCTYPVAGASSAAHPYVGGVIRLYGAPDGMAFYSWIGPNGFSSGLQNPVIPNVTPAMAGTYTLTVTSDYGCTDVVSMDLEVDPYGPYGPVGWETRPIDKVHVLLPWIALLAAIVGGVTLLVLRRRRV